MFSSKLLERYTQCRIPKALIDEPQSEPVVPLFKLHKVTTYSTYTYKLGDIYTIRLDGMFELKYGKFTMLKLKLSLLS